MYVLGKTEMFAVNLESIWCLDLNFPPSNFFGTWLGSPYMGHQDVDQWNCVNKLLLSCIVLSAIFIFYVGPVACNLFQLHPSSSNINNVSSVLSALIFFTVEHIYIYISIYICWQFIQLPFNNDTSRKRAGKFTTEISRQMSVSKF